MAPCVICISREPPRIQPNICVERGTHDVPDPSWLMGSPRSVVDAMFIASIVESLIFILAPIGAGDIDPLIFIPSRIGAGDICTAPGSLMGVADGEAAGIVFALADVVAEDVGTVVIFGVGSGRIVIPGIGAIVACGAGCAA